MDASLLLRAALGAAVLVASGCDLDGAADPDVDEELVDAMIDLHLADARAVAEADERAGDSLRALVYAAHGLDSTALHGRLETIAANPEAARALATAIEERLSAERRGTPSPDATDS